MYTPRDMRRWWYPRDELSPRPEQRQRARLSRCITFFVIAVLSVLCWGVVILLGWALLRFIAWQDRVVAVVG